MRAPITKYYIVDLVEVFMAFNRRPALMDVFKRFPLDKIIEHILSISPYIDYSDRIYIEIETRFEDVIDRIDLDSINILLELIVSEVDQTVSKRICLPENKIYLFERWLDRTSIVLKVE